MEFRHLRCFTVLAEELHFGRAAMRLAMTQPPLSLAIQQLEADLGARLFERNSRGVALTAAGAAFRPRALALLQQAALAAREARDVGQGLAGQLQIGFAGTVLYRGLPQVLRDFSAAHPGLRLALRELSSSATARGRNARPAAVSATPRLLRSNRRAPTSASSCWMAMVNGGCVMARRWAARPKCSSSASTVKQRR